jgi:hypothetical protein
MLKLSLLAALCAAMPAPGQPAFLAPATLSAPGSAGPRGLVAADLDGDRDLDLVVAYATSNHLRIFVNDGGGGYAPGPALPTGPAPFAVIAADLDGDGDLDLAATESGGAAVSLFFNSGGGFGAGVTLPVGAGPRGLAAADLDLDGDQDLVTANATAGTVSILLRAGGAFLPAVDHSAGLSPRSVAVADLDQDGWPDLVVAAGNQGQVMVLRGLGAGAFAPAVGAGTGSALTVDVAMADLDGDGDPDVVAANFLGPTVTVLLNDGTGALTASSFWNLGVHLQGIALADLDWDGQPDLAAIDVGLDQVHVAAGSAGGFLPAVQSLPTGPGVAAIAILDLDGDFHPDLAVTRFSGDSVALIRNAHPLPALGACAAGSTPGGSGGLFDALRLDGSAGGPPRRGTVGLGQPFAFDVLPPPGTAAPPAFFVWGYVGAATLATRTTLPFQLGETCIPVWHLSPSDPSTFLVADSFFASGEAFLPATRAPFSTALLAPPFPLLVTLQGLIEGPAGLHVTNGILLDVR